jgi:hypothetical protein
MQVMMACFDHTRASFFFFVSFIMIATFFMMNLFTAAAYLKYQECEEQYENNAVSATEAHLLEAFELLDANSSGDLDRGEILAVMVELRQASMLPGIAQVTTLPPSAVSLGCGNLFQRQSEPIRASVAHFTSSS